MLAVSQCRGEFINKTRENGEPNLSSDVLFIRKSSLWAVRCPTANKGGTGWNYIKEVNPEWVLTNGVRQSFLLSQVPNPER